MRAPKAETPEPNTPLQRSTASGLPPNRRMALGMLSALGLQPMTVLGADAGSCSAIPDAPRGPYPADGSNRLSMEWLPGSPENALALPGIERRDIRTSVNGHKGKVTGVPLTLALTLVDAAAGCAPLVGRAIYVWHCAPDGGYSMYSAGHTDENYLRGVQLTDANGAASFATVFPGCYPGRWPHIHFEIYPDRPTALSAPAGDWRKVSELALPESACRQAYTQGLYGESQRNLAQTSLERDYVFRNGQGRRMMATVTGNATAGYVANLTVGL